mmetsp:Transcript_13985/g.45643  ORF Transcript_13985/g.45643 Transcript_13985/m.45643 type:complete len:342 (+) Transcript_13985:126-1151(+)|eukprot:CAMPEP_0118910782 /NCGR_PEP_ID=MMETSP1166-20130328/12772_1 /TAXON_ID=1104430 /ORGANISM="Chrysoreinhardia sp, Strain CCMP3193" /LENGTH=341 /DNA_ID=CAMNT_0006850255 /DNA_START=86 /DNA_END=1111 /DNA_ORIENTATION=+
MDDHDEELATLTGGPRCNEDLSARAAMIRLSKLSETEELYQPRATYISDVQVDGMTEGWRHKITVWFDQLAESFKMSTETLSVAANYLDRYLSAESCGSLKFQLASVASIFLASKVEEARPFKTADFVTLSDEIFSAADLRLMELELLCTLKWHLHPPTFHTFVNLLVLLFDKRQVDFEAVCVNALRFAESTRLHADFIKYPPSMIAVASVMCALKQLQVHPDVVTTWMHLVNQCHLSYASRPDATRHVTECGLKLIQLEGAADLVHAQDSAVDAEVEHATSSVSNDENNQDQPPDEDDPAERKQAGTPTDVMDIEQIEKFNSKFGMVLPVYDDGTSLYAK